MTENGRSYPRRVLKTALRMLGEFKFSELPKVLRLNYDKSTVDAVRRGLREVGYLGRVERVK
jgi:hypothetical protein